MDPQLKLRPLVGETITEIIGLKVDSDAVTFVTESGKRLAMHHHQNCCEHVRVVGASRGWENRLGRVLSVSEKINDTVEASESATESIFTIKTTKGTIKIEWLGESNGWYGEGVDFDQIS